MQIHVFSQSGIGLMAKRMSNLAFMFLTIEIASSETLTTHLNVEFSRRATGHSYSLG